MGLFDEIIETVGDEGKEYLAKYPKIREKVEELEGKFTEADGLLSQWETWKAAQWDDQSKMTKAEAQARRELARVQERAAQLESMQGADMGFDEILKGLKEQGMLTKDDLKTLTDPTKPDSFVDRATHENGFQQLSNGIEYFYGATAHLPVTHKDEFGEVFKVKELLKYMNENRLADPEAAYERMVAPKREEARKAAETQREADVTAKIEAARKEEREKTLRESAMGQGKLPTDQGEGSPLGHLQAARMKRGPDEGKDDKGTDIPEGVKLGQGTLAQLGFEEYRNSKMGSVQ